LKKLIYILPLLLFACAKTEVQRIESEVQQKPISAGSFKVDLVGRITKDSAVTLEAGVFDLPQGDSVTDYQFAGASVTIVEGQQDWFGFAEQFEIVNCDNQTLIGGNTYDYSVTVTDKLGDTVISQTQIFVP
jgi:hypothetical protein